MHRGDKSCGKGRLRVTAMTINGKRKPLCVGEEEGRKGRPRKERVQRERISMMKSSVGAKIVE